MSEDAKKIKQRIRQHVWRLLEEKRLASFPRPVYGRIPNFKGSPIAAEKLATREEFLSAKVVKVNPDAPQRMIRYHTLRQGKTLLMPTPRLRGGFIILEPAKIEKKHWLKSASISGAFTHGQTISLHELPHVDLIVAGSVAVTKDGARVGKGEGYSELEYAVLRELGAVDNSVKILTTVHDIQIVEKIPVEAFDVPLDLIVTPTQTIKISTPRKKPHGIYWDKLDPSRIEEMPILKELKAKSKAPAS